MKTLIEINEEKERYAKKRLFQNVLIISISALFALALTLSVLLSKDHYLIPMWICIVLSVAYIWWMIYYLSLPYKEVGRYIKFYKSAENGIRQTDYVVVIGYSEEEESKDGMDAKVLKTAFSEKGKAFERDFYLLGECPDFKKDEMIKVDSFSSVIISYEVSHE